VTIKLPQQTEHNGSLKKPAEASSPKWTVAFQNDDKNGCGLHTAKYYGGRASGHAFCRI